MRIQRVNKVWEYLIQICVRWREQHIQALFWLKSVVGVLARVETTLSDKG